MSGSVRLVLFVAVLALSRLGPVPVSAQANDLAGGGLAGPVRAVSWHPVPEECRHVTSMIWVRDRTHPAEAAQLSRQKPPGLAAVLETRVRGLFGDPRDACRTPDGELTAYSSPWSDHGVETIRAKVVDFYSAFANAGGRLDLLILDYEKTLSNWSMSKGRLRAIAADGRAAELKRRLGFDDLTRVLEFSRSPHYLTWNATMHAMISEAVDRAVFDPVAKIFPRAISSNYGAFTLTRENVVPERNGHRQHYLTHCGTHGSGSFYGDIGQLAAVKLDGSRRYGRDPFAVVRWQVNMMRAIRRSSEVPFMAWVSNKRYERSELRDNAYYEELIYHLALSGAEVFLYWNPYPRKNTDKPADAYADAQQDLLFDACLDKINARLEGLGGGRGACVTLDPIAWDSSLIATGMRVGRDRALWRVTVPSGVAPGSRRVRVEPGGCVLECGDAVGFWYETTAEEAVSFILDRSGDE